MIVSIVALVLSTIVMADRIYGIIKHGYWGDK